MINFNIYRSLALEIGIPIDPDVVVMSDLELQDFLKSRRPFSDNIEFTIVPEGSDLGSVAVLSIAYWNGI